MTDAPDLSGHAILIVEDDFYQASDTAAVLLRAGARVLGPCASEQAARQLLEAETPTAAVVDLNLGGGGPRFEIAALLRARGVPFVFLTGYDPDVIPEEMAGVRRLQKPVRLHEIVEAVRAL
jgi:DNA-binding response OmpR family regulator